MAINNFPPQAYTRDVLTQAYEWGRTQPASIREMATDADSLVALYFQSRRRPIEQPTVTPSSQAFKNDLKVLAEGIKQFEEQPATKNLTEKFSAEKSYNFNQTQKKVNTSVAQEVKDFEAASVNSNSSNTSLSNTNSLDSKSLELVRAVQTKLNLSQESEALRMIIAMGYDRIREILPK